MSRRSNNLTGWQQTGRDGHGAGESGVNGARTKNRGEAVDVSKKDAVLGSLTGNRTGQSETADLLLIVLFFLFPSVL